MRHGDGQCTCVRLLDPCACKCRFRGGCRRCPDTAWLLFLLFTIGLLALVSLSVYLSKKRLNLAVLGIGVVRDDTCPLVSTRCSNEA